MSTWSSNVFLALWLIFYVCLFVHEFFLCWYESKCCVACWNIIRHQVNFYPALESLIDVWCSPMRSWFFYVDINLLVLRAEKFQMLIGLNRVIFVFLDSMTDIWYRFFIYDSLHTILSADKNSKMLPGMHRVNFYLR